jgi:hypothetical protein
MKIKTEAAVLGALVGALLMVGAGQAWASSTQSLTYGGIKRATSNFYSPQDTLNVTDNYSDGWGALSHFNSATTGSKTCTNESGAGFVKVCDYNIPAGQSVSYDICSKNGSTILACSPSPLPDVAG